jgi:hypothetical protein
MSMQPEVPVSDVPESRDGRRIAEVNWRSNIDEDIVLLKKGQQDINDKLTLNNEMTEAMLVIFNNTKAFWSFCTKCSKICIWLAKYGTIIAACIVGIYHAIDAVASHDLTAAFKEWWRKP